MSLGQATGQAGAETGSMRRRWSAETSKVREDGGREPPEEAGRQARVIVEHDQPPSRQARDISW